MCVIEKEYKTIIFKKEIESKWQKKQTVWIEHLLFMIKHRIVNATRMSSFVKLLIYSVTA